jgi:hypothetical protein
MLLLNQALMMLWEAILENATLVTALLLILLVAWGYWGVAGRHKKMAHRLAMMLAVAVAVLGFFTVPLFFSATLGDLTYWVDWAFHLAMVIALLVYAYIVLLPLATGVAGVKRRA